MAIKRIDSKQDLQEVARKLGVRPDWHEPDEQEVTAETRGTSFDNAGFWGSEFEAECENETRFKPEIERYVQIKKDGKIVAEVNLATLLALACE